ncbi:MAG: YbaN family protein [Planctomycetota bacterium]
MRTLRRAADPVLVGLGVLFLAVAGVGIFVPLLPTTPFVILAAFLFSRGSPRLHQWLRSQRHFGAALRRWEDHGVIQLRAKILATVLITLAIAYPMFFTAMSTGIRVGAGVVTALVVAFIWTRPSDCRPDA